MTRPNSGTSAPTEIPTSEAAQLRTITTLTDRRASLRAVDRAVGDLRRGDFVLVRPDSGPALLTMASECASEESLARLTALGGRRLSVLVTLQRAAALGLGVETSGVMEIELPAGSDAVDLIQSLSDPLEMVDAERIKALARRAVQPAAQGSSQDGVLAAVRLAKLARLLPAVVVAEIDRPLGTERLMARTDVLSVTAFDIDNHDLHAAMSLNRVADARVPLDGAEDTTIVAFRPTDGGQEHLAIVIGDPDPASPVLVRLHSECFTGDLLGSLRCDCGQQLRGAIDEIARTGNGVLVYLAQEGRGIGLINKLRAYRLQDADFDTVDANEMLGYDADERIYQPAARMLQCLNITQVRLMTNNPDKVDQLAACGITVVDRVPHSFPANGHNEFYLSTKRHRSGHMY